MEKRLKKCCICGKEYEGQGNNPYPVKPADLECCNACSFEVVMPSRMNQSNKRKQMEQELEKVKRFIGELTRDMETNTKVELLQDLAWWAAEEAGQLDFESPDYEEEE
ncbi:MAG: hypothetical protein J1E97_07920 [Muribaculaceae bacterium]|nr:hypothetical protein [Muribaculaceae bacterium]